MKGFFDKMTGKTSKAEQAAADEKRRQDEIERQREISRLAVEKANSSEGQKWRKDLQKEKIAKIEQDIKLRERQLNLSNSSIETDPELLKLKRQLEDIKNGVTSDFNLKLAELRNADTSSSMSMSNSNTSSLQMPMSTSMPMSMPKSSVPYNYDPFKPYKPKQPVGNDISNRRFQVPESFDEEKVEKYLNEEDFDGGRRRRRTKRRISRNSKKSKKTKRVKRTKRVKKSRKSKKSKTIKY